MPISSHSVAVFLTICKPSGNCLMTKCPFEKSSIRSDGRLWHFGMNFSIRNAYFHFLVLNNSGSVLNSTMKPCKPITKNYSLNMVAKICFFCSIPFVLSFFVLSMADFPLIQQLFMFCSGIDNGGSSFYVYGFVEFQQ